MQDKEDAQKDEHVKDKDRDDDRDNDRINKGRDYNKQYLENKKRERKEAKIDAKGFLKELKAFFRFADLITRKDILAEIAQVKRELMDFTISAFFRGVEIDFDRYDGVRPVIENDRTLAPVRAVLEALGADLTWKNDTRSTADGVSCSQKSTG